MCFHDLIIHMCTRPIETKFIMVMMVNVVNLLFISSRTRMAFYNESPV